MNRSLMLVVDRANVIPPCGGRAAQARLHDRTNIKVTELLELLLASTSEVYCKLDEPKFSEDDDAILGPTSKVRWC